jgi:hypothetical protein
MNAIKIVMQARRGDGVSEDVAAIIGKPSVRISIGRSRKSVFAIEPLFIVNFPIGGQQRNLLTRS